MKELIYACEIRHEGSNYQVLLIAEGKKFEVKAHIIKFEHNKKHTDLGYHEVKDLFGNLTMVPKVVLVELKYEKGEELETFRNICVGRIRRQFFPRRTTFRVMKK